MKFACENNLYQEHLVNSVISDDCFSVFLTKTFN